MKKTAVAACLLIVTICASAAAQDARTTLDAAAKALGTANLRTLEFSGRGFDYIFGQPYDGISPWPRFAVPAMTMTIDFATPALRDDRRRQQALDRIARHYPAVVARLSGLTPTIIHGELYAANVLNTATTYDSNVGGDGVAVRALGVGAELDRPRLGGVVVRQAAVLLVLDAVEDVQDAIHLGIGLDLVVLPVRLLVALWVEAEDPEVNLHRWGAS